MEIAAQVFGILAFIASVISYQLKTYRNILWTQLVCALLFVTHFFLLWQSGRADAITGAALNGVCAVRDVVLLLTEKNRTRKLTVLLTVIFSAAVVAVGLLNYHGFRALCLRL